MNRLPLCHVCRFFVNPCLCAYATHFDNQNVHIALIMNVSEYHRSSNSGKLLHLAFAHTSTHIRGVRGNPLDYEKIMEGYEQVLCLFPHESAVNIDMLDVAHTQGGDRAGACMSHAAGVGDGEGMGDGVKIGATSIKQTLLLVPDGNWPQGAKIANRLAFIPRVKFVKVQVEKKPYLRHNPDLERISTFEAVFQALKTLEATPSWDASALYDAFLSRHLQLRGQYKTINSKNPCDVTCNFS